MPLHCVSDFTRIAPRDGFEHLRVFEEHEEGHGGDVVGFADFGLFFGVDAEDREGGWVVRWIS